MAITTRDQLQGAIQWGTSYPILFAYLGDGPINSQDLLVNAGLYPNGGETINLDYISVLFRPFSISLRLCYAAESYSSPDRIVDSYTAPDRVSDSYTAPARPSDSYTAPSRRGGKHCITL